MPVMAEGSPSVRLVLDAGFIVSLESANGLKVKGQVIAFDFRSNLLFLKCSAQDPPATSTQGASERATSSQGASDRHDLYLFNINRLKKIEVIDERATLDFSLPVNLDLTKLKQRTEENIAKRRRQVKQIGVNVSEEAQSLCNTIAKTLEVEWRDKNILVMGSVVISPPYTEDSVTRPGSNLDSPQLLDHVKKIVRQHLDQVKQQHLDEASSQ